MSLPVVYNYDLHKCHGYPCSAFLSHVFNEEPLITQTIYVGLSAHRTPPSTLFWSHSFIVLTGVILPPLWSVPTCPRRKRLLTDARHFRRPSLWCAGDVIPVAFGRSHIVVITGIEIPFPHRSWKVWSVSLCPVQDPMLYFWKFTWLNLQ